MKKFSAVGSYSLPSDGSSVYPCVIYLSAGTYEVWVGIDAPNGGLIAGSINNADATVFPLEPIISMIPNVTNAGLCSKGLYKLTSDGNLTLALNSYSGSAISLNHVAMTAEAVTL